MLRTYFKYFPVNILFLVLLRLPLLSLLSLSSMSLELVSILSLIIIGLYRCVLYNIKVNLYGIPQLTILGYVILFLIIILISGVFGLLCSIVLGSLF